MSENKYEILFEKMKVMLDKDTLRLNEPMRMHSTFRTGGNAAVYAEVSNILELSELMRTIYDNGFPYYIIGNGSNILVKDEGFDGIIIKMGEEFGGRLSTDILELNKMDDTFHYEKDGYVFTAWAHEMLAPIAREKSLQGLTGMEAMTGIPGTVGGAVAMNAGAYGTEMKDIVEQVLVMNKFGETRVLKEDDLEFSYRDSNIQRRGYIVLKAKMRLHKGDMESINRKMIEYQVARKEKQPLEYPSAGSTFKRPEGNYAGKLIEEAGLRGYTVGGAQVSEKHCGFVINKTGASASDIIQVINDVIDRVYETSGVRLEPEVKIIG